MFLDRQPHPSKEVNSPQTDTITVKTPERFLVNTDETLKFIWESTETKLDKKFWIKKNKAEGIQL